MSRTNFAVAPLTAALFLGVVLTVTATVSAAPRPEDMADGYITGRVRSTAGPEA